MFKSILRQWRLVEADEHDEAFRQIPRPPGWRSAEDEGDLPEGDYSEWAQEHMAVTPHGSLVIGSVHADPEDEQSPGGIYHHSHVVPTVLQHAHDAIRGGKRITFVAEGGTGEDAPGDGGHLARELVKHFGHRVGHDTWDDKPVNVYDQTSPIWKRLYNATGNRALVHAALTAFMAGQGDDPGLLRRHGILTPEGHQHLQQQGIDPFDPQHVQTMYAMMFPKDQNSYPISGGTHNELSLVGEHYNAARQQNLLKKLRDIEQRGHVGIVHAGASHVYNLKPTLEGGRHHEL